MIVDEVKVFHHEEEIPLSQSRVAKRDVLFWVAKKGINFVGFLGKTEGEG